MEHNQIVVIENQDHHQIINKLHIEKLQHHQLVSKRFVDQKYETFVSRNYLCS